MSVQDDITRIIWNLEVPPHTSVNIEEARKEKQFCRNCGKRDSAFSQKDTVHFWEPGLCMVCHHLPAIGMRYDVFTGKRIEPKVQWDANCLKRLAGIPEHDGKLDDYDDYSVSYVDPIYTVYGPMDGIRVKCHGGPEQADLTYKQALSLLVWLTQEKGRLEELEKEQAE